MTKREIFYQRKSNLIAKKIKDEFIVIDPNTDSFYVLNEIAELIFKFLYKKRTLKEIIKKVTSDYNVLRNKIGDDIKEFLKNNELLKN